MDKAQVESVISSFNKKSKEKAKLVEAIVDSITIQFSGIEMTEDARQYFEAFRQMLEKQLQLAVAIEKIEKTNGSHLVRFAQNPSPADDIIKTLKKYYDGTTPYGEEGYED